MKSKTVPSDDNDIMKCCTPETSNCHLDIILTKNGVRIQIDNHIKLFQRHHSFDAMMISRPFPIT